jgi:hypothetical protein
MFNYKKRKRDILLKILLYYELKGRDRRRTENVQYTSL